MAKTTTRAAMKLGVVGAVAVAASAVFIGVSAGTAHADVTEVGVDHRVSSRQSSSTTSGGVRPDSTWGEVRGTDIGDVHAHGEVRGSIKAVPTRPRTPRADTFRSGWHHGIQGGLR